MLVRILFLLLITAGSIGQLSCTPDNSIAGGGSNTGNANILAGVIRKPDGQTPAECIVYLYPSDALPVPAGNDDTNIVATTSTDTAGRYVLTGIIDGTYNVYCIDTAGALSLLVPEQTVSGNDSLFIGEDTLHPFGSIMGRISNAAAGVSSIAFIYGSPIITTINDTSGFFSFNNLPVGNKLSITFLTKAASDGRQCRAEYRYSTLPDTTAYISVLFECDQ